MLAILLLGACPAGAATAYVAYAGNGDGIPHPLATNTYTVTTNGVTVAVPEGMVYVPAGTFVMNTNTAASNVTLAAYAIGKFHVTCAEYKAFLDANASVSAPSYWTNRMYPAGKSNHCVLYVSLTNASRYCAWVSSNTGWNIRIPTEAQWEKAARGTNGGVYPWGNTQGSSYSGGVLTSRMNYNGVVVAHYLNQSNAAPATYNNASSPYYGTTVTVGTIAAYDTNGAPTALAINSSGSVSGFVNHTTFTGFIYTDVFTALNGVGGFTTPVGSYPNGVSPYGCHDMAGQCWDWTSTLFVAVNGAEAGQTVNNIRGGSWYANGTSCRSINIGEGRAGSGAFNTVGFRVVMIPQPEKPVIKSATRLAGGAVQLQSTGTALVSHRVLASTNLVNWIPIATNNTALNGLLDFVDNDAATFTNRYYRVVAP
jgi:formylglycine-generating enzyme required for sulfatase activity